jgi:hypothetical protein
MPRLPAIAKPTLLQRIQLRTLYGRVRIHREHPTKLFMFHCGRTGFYIVDQEHGFDGYLCGNCERCEFRVALAFASAAELRIKA